VNFASGIFAEIAALEIAGGDVSQGLDNVRA
jgi:hypothetical protein